MALSDEIDHHQRIAELEQALRRTQVQLRTATEQTGAIVAAVYQAAHDAALVNGTPAPAALPSRDRRRASAEVALLHLTDIHIGAVTETYNTEIAARRVGDTIAKTLKLTEIARADHPVHECVVLLGGDLIEQTAQFAHQAWGVDATTFDQVFTAARVIGDALLTLATHYTQLTVYEVPGNHGRVGRGKGRQSLDYEAATNWDRIVGRVVRDQLASQPRIEWHDADTWYHVGAIGEYRFLVHHGDTIRGFGGNIPAYGIIRKHLSWASGVMPKFTDAYIGHFHIPMTLPLAAGQRVFVSPSLVSDSPFAKEWMASTSVPGQRLHFIDPERGRVTSEHLLWLD